jgi:hypothetical protein
LLEVHVDKEAGRYSFLITNGSGFVRSFDNAAGAWDFACSSEHDRAGVIPIVGPGGMFLSDSGTRAKANWTYDPRFARTLPVADATPEQIKAARDATVRFIRSKIGDRFTLDTSEAEHNPADYDSDLIAEAEAAAATAESPETIAESPAPEPAEPSEGEAPADEFEAVRARLSDSDRNAFDNYRHMSETVESESARKFWRGMVEDMAGAAW